MKISVSNIAWDNQYFSEYLGFLRHLGCSGVELAPSCIWQEPIEASAAERRHVSRLIEENHLDLVGFHALLYTRPDLSLFTSKETLNKAIAYLAELARLCSDMQGRVLVFGSPRNRALSGRSYSECVQWAQEGFYSLSEICKALGVFFCIEPLGPDETDFIRSAREGAEMVRNLSHPNFRLHLDAKALISTGESIDEILDEFGDLLTHFHVGDPGLTPPGSTGANHVPFGRALKRLQYPGYVSIEMRRIEEDSKRQIANSVEYVRRCYADVALDG